MAKFIVWGNAPVRSKLVKEAEPAFNRQHPGNYNEIIDRVSAELPIDGNSWIVEVECAYEEVDAATRFDNGVIGFEEVEEA